MGIKNTILLIGFSILILQAKGLQNLVCVANCLMARNDCINLCQRKLKSSVDESICGKACLAHTLNCENSCPICRQHPMCVEGCTSHVILCRLNCVNADSPKKISKCYEDCVVGMSECFAYCGCIRKHDDDLFGIL